MIGSRPGRSHTGGPSCQIPKTFERVNCLRPLCPAQAILLSCFIDYRTAVRLQDPTGVCCTLCWVSPPVIVVGRRCKHVPGQLVGSMGSSTAALRAQPVCRGVANRAVFLPGVSSNRIYSALNALGLYNKNAKILFLVSHAVLGRSAVGWEGGGCSS